MWGNRMEELFEILVFFGMIALAVYSSKKKREQRLEELKKQEAERQRRTAQSQNARKSSSNDIVRRRKENDKAAKEIEKRRVAQQAEADSTRIHSSLHEKEEKFDFEDQDLMQEVYDLIAYGCDGSDFLRRLEKENHFQSSLDATING